MSSVAIRTIVKNYVAANSLEKTADLTGGYEKLEDFLDDNNIGMLEPWLALQFIGNDEVPITVASVPGQGKFRETGLVYFHVVDVAKLGVHDSILARLETLRGLFRGKNINGFRVQSVSPPNTELGATLEFESGFIAASFFVEYDYDLDI